MNTHDIELPPLPTPFGIVDPEVKERLMQYTEKDLQDYAKAYARAAIEPYAKRIAQLEAARFAYASEFPPNEDGDPDVGRIHENIRKLKADRKRRQSEAEEVCGEAYQVVGSLLSDLGIFETEHAEKILDNLSQARMVHKDVLPWHSYDRKRRGEPDTEHEKWLASLSPEDRMFEEIDQMARESYKRHMSLKRGQMVVRADAWESHLIWATKRWIEINEPAPRPQPAEPDEERLAMEAVMESVDPATWPGLTLAQRCALGRFAKPQPAEPVKVPSDDEILFAMRHLERHLKCIDGAIPTLLSTARALLARYGKGTP